MQASVPSEIESRIVQEAARLGIDAAEYAGRLIVEQLNARTGPSSSLDELLGQWNAEDATDDPAEIEARNREFDQLRQEMNRARLESEGPQARKPWP